MGDLRQLFSRRGGRRVEDGATLRVAYECPIEEHGVEVHIQVDAGAETLNVRHGPGCDAVEAVASSARTVSREDGFDEDPREAGEHVCAEGCEGPQLERQRQDPLAYGYARQHTIDQVRGGIGHTPACAARTYGASLARKSDEQVVAAGVAVGTHETVREDAAA
jgi:hypothetical protein